MHNYLNIWVTFALFVGVVLWLGILNNWVVDALKKERNNRLETDRDLERLLESWRQQMLYAQTELEQRVKDLESPPILKDVKENRVCPECGEDKEISTDDYLCEDCREPENIAA